MKVLIDTNFFLLPNQFGIDIFEYLKYFDSVTLSSCVEELKKLAKKGGKDGKAAKIGLKLLKENSVDVLKDKPKGKSSSTDKAILDYAIAEKCMVATNDAVLIKALKSHGLKVIRLKQRKYLEEE
jgi:rRNA-processing protein FCF1